MTSPAFWEYLQLFFGVGGLSIAIGSSTFLYYAYRTKAPAIPSEDVARDAIISVIREEIASRNGGKVKICDMGSGLGGLCMAISKAFPEAEVAGLELAWPACLIAWFKKTLCLRGNLSFKCCDFWKHDIGEYDIVVCYLFDSFMRKLGPKLRNESRDNRLIISNTFPLPDDWTPIQRVPVTAKYCRGVIVYRQP